MTEMLEQKMWCYVKRGPFVYQWAVNGYTSDQLAKYVASFQAAWVDDGPSTDAEVEAMVRRMFPVVSDYRLLPTVSGK